MARAIAPADWPADATLPPLHLRDGTLLPPAEMAALLQLLRHELPTPVPRHQLSFHAPQWWRKSSLPEPLRMAFDALRARCDAAALDAWAAALLRAWLRDIGTGTARKIRWVVPTAGLFGGDACAALIGAHLRVVNYELRCTFEVGMDALLDIGTRGALAEIAHTARKLASKYRGQEAQKALQALAASQGLTSAQLQDRILPDGGFDATGRQVFDYGPRQFEVLLDDHLVPVLRAADGRQLTALPKPNSKDDAALARTARAAWKVAKTQIAQTTRQLAARFEAAMVSGETWSMEDFDACFRRHPLARNVVRRLLWLSAATTGEAVADFRIAEDDTLADVNDTPIDLPAAAIRIRPIHPLELDARGHVAWQRVFTEYQIVSPFPQLERKVFQPSHEEAELRALTPLSDSRFEPKALIFSLENRGWTRVEEDGAIFAHVRSFLTLGMKAIVRYEPGTYVWDLSGLGPQRLTELVFETQPREPLPLRDVPPIVFSETLRDIHSLVPIV